MMNWRIFLPFVASYLVLGAAAFLLPGAPFVFRGVLLVMGLGLFFGGAWLATRSNPADGAP